MRRVFALLLALLAAGPAAAEGPLALRAGDQGGLSRLVIDLPPATPWSMEQAGRDVTLRFPALALAFDTRAVFPDRKASRLLTARSRAEATGTVLVITLACDCRAEAFALGPRKLVLDVRDSAAPASPAASAPARAEAEAPRTPLSPPAPPPAPPVPPPAAPPAALTAEDEAAVAAARARLIGRLARAAEEGLVEMRTPPAPAAPAAPPAPAAPSEPAAEAPAAAAPETPSADILVHTARERDRALDREPPAPPPACLPDAALDVAAWGGTEPVAAQISAARRALLGEFDRVDEAALARLVRLHIHYGFGLEAEDLLAHMGITLAEGPLLADLARLIEGRPADPRGPLAAQAGCPGRAALWGLLARLDPATGAPPPGAAPDIAAIEAALAELPAVPRRLTGPRAARALLELGLLEPAARLLALTARIPGDPGDEYHLARAALLAAQGRHEDAEAIWQALVAANRAGADAALVALTESRLARGLAPPERIAEDLAARAFTQRDTAAGEALQMAEIEARAAAGELGPALGILAEGLRAAPPRAPELRAAAARVIARARAETVGPALYAAALLGHADLLAEDAGGDPARLVAAAELTAIGLPNAALGLLAPALARGQDEVRLAAARAELALNRPEAALALLDGLAAPEAAAIRAGARARLGDHAGALEALAGTAAPEEERARLAFAAGDWQRALATGDPVARVLAAYMAGLDAEAAALPAADPAAPAPLAAFLAPPRLEEPVTLGLARDAIDISRSTRELLSRRLAAPGH